MPSGVESWSLALVDSYGYNEAQIDFRSDSLGVFRDHTHREPLCLIAPAAAKLDQWLLEARKAFFPLLAIGEPAAPSVVAVSVHDGDPTSLPGLPTWMPSHKRRGLVSRRTTLLPFGSERDLRSAFEACHDAIYLAMANDPAATFDLVLLTLASKLLDERGSCDGAYEFALVAQEPPDERAQRFSRLLGAAHDWLGGHDAAGGVMPSVGEALATRLLEIFQDYSLTLTANSVAGTDVLGEAYQSIVGSTFRGELGSYFTPRTIADFLARMIDDDITRVLDPACGSGGLLLAIRRAKGEASGATEYYGNDLNPRMVNAAKVNYLLHGLDPENVMVGNGLELDRVLAGTLGIAVPPDGTWLDALPDGPFDAVVANPPFAGHERASALLERIATAHKGSGGLRSLNRTLPFIETIVASLREGGVAALVLPTSVLNAEEETFVKLRGLILEHAEVLAIVGLPEKAFVHTDCGVHGVLLFLRRAAKPRREYAVFVDWAERLGYDRLGRSTRENDFPAILGRYASTDWPAANCFTIEELRQAGRWDPAWLHVARSLPRSDGGDFVPLTDLVEVRNARFSRRGLHDSDRYRFFEVADTDLAVGTIETIHEVSGFELRKKGRIKNRVRAGDILLPNHRDSLIAKSAPTGRSAVLVEDEHDGVLTTDRFLVLRPKMDPLAVQVLLNSAGVRRQIVAQCRGAASLDIREKTLSEILVPRALLDDDAADAIVRARTRIHDLRAQLQNETRELAYLVEPPFGVSSSDFRPAGWKQL